MNKSDQWFKKKSVKPLLFMTAVILPVVIYNRKKTLPEGLSYASDVHYTDQVEFLHNLTYYTKNGDLKHELLIYEEMEAMIAGAKQFIIADMFLFNGYRNGNDNLPKITEKLTAKIIEQKRKYPALQVVFITDPLNIGYYSCQNDRIEQLEENGVQVVMTDLLKLRDPNPLYSAVWRVFFRPFGWKGKGWLPNPLAASDAPKVTLRSYLELFNIKANHRKVLITEEAALITSANPNDAGGFFSNIGFKVKGDIIKDAAAAEQAVAMYSSSHFITLSINDKFSSEEQTGSIALKYLTEDKVHSELLKELEKAGAGHEVWLGALYLSEHKVVEKITEAADRGAMVRIILDLNESSFSRKKHGLPNVAVARALVKRNKDRIKVRWFRTPKEQYHTKLLYIKKKQEGVLLGGSANFTIRSLGGFNLESALLIKADAKEKVMVDVEQYFHRIWNNEGGMYTSDHNPYNDKLLFFRLAGYHLQKLIHYTTY